MHLVAIHEHYLERFYFEILAFCMEMENDLVCAVEEICHFFVGLFHLVYYKNTNTTEHEKLAKQIIPSVNYLLYTSLNMR